MTVFQSENQKLYDNATVQSSVTFNRLKEFFAIRRDDYSPFSVEQILEAYPVCKSGKTFVARPGDVIAVMASNPKGKRVNDMLRVRHAYGLYGLMEKTDGFALEADSLQDDFDRDYYIISTSRDGRVLDSLSRECVSIRIVGQVTRKGYSLFTNGELSEELEKPEIAYKTAEIPDDYCFRGGYLKGFANAFTDSELAVNGNVGMALGVFAAYSDCRYDRVLNYKGVSAGDGLFVYPVSRAGALPDTRAKKVYKKIKKACKKGQASGCVLFNDGNLISALERLTGTAPEKAPVPLREGVWYVLIASRKPMRDGIYLGRV